MPTISARSRRLRTVATVALLGTIGLPGAADAAPRLTGLTVPTAVEGTFSRAGGNAPIICTANRPVVATFTSGSPGTLYAVISDGMPLNNPLNTGVGRTPIRKGANTVDLAGLTTVFNGPGFRYGGPLVFSRSVFGEPGDRPVSQGWKVTLIATDRFGLPSAQASRSVRVTCAF